MTVAQFLPRPVIEILSPPNGHVEMATELSIRVALRWDSLRVPADAHRVCIALTTVATPPEVVLAPDALAQERCYEQQDQISSYHADGLLPGVKYAVSAALVNGGKVVGVSMRTVHVAAIQGDVDSGGVVHLSIAETMRVAREFHLQDRRTAAVQLYERVLELFPRHAGALHHLGQAYYQDGQTGKAIELIDQAIEIDSSDASMHLSLGLCLKVQGHTSEAVQVYRRALELRPSYIHAALGLGHLMQVQGKWEEALHEFRKVVSTANDAPPEPQIVEPPHERMVIDALAWLCELLRLTDGLYEAERCLSQATKRFPDEVRFHIDRGHLLLFGGQFESAQREYETASQLGSVHAMTHAADVLEALGDYEGSLDLYRQVLESPHTRSSTVQNQIAIMVTTVLPRILPASQATIDSLRERFRENVLSILNALDRGMHHILVDPSRIPFSTAITMNSHNQNNRELKRVLGKMYFGLFIDPGAVREEYVNSYGITPIPYHQQYTPNTPFQQPRIRVGFVSRFFYNGAVGLFMNELLSEFNASKFEVFAFGIGLSKSVKSYDQVAQIAEHVVALPRDLHMAREEIRAHLVDILIYPELGMDKTTYFLAYHRLAPVQAAWWGNPDTTGVPTIDYYITSEHEHKDFRDHYTEPVYQMRGMGIYHSMPPLSNSTVTREDIRRAVQERFNLARDFRFYLSIESILHFHPDFDEALRLIFQRDPLANVFLLGSSNRKNWKKQLLDRIETHIGPEFVGRVLFFMDVDAHQEILLLGAADAVLGSLYLTRPKAAMQAFTAGVPVVTLASKLWATRITAGLYKQMGIRGLTTTTIQAYANLAVKLATDEAFRDRMVQKIRRNRDRLSNDQAAVQEWEKFFEMAASRLAGHDNQGVEQSQNQDSRSNKDTSPQPIDAMTCPATTLLHLW